MSIRNWTRAKKMHHGVLLAGMILSVVTFGIGQELLAAGIIIVAVGAMALIKRRSDRPVYDERDISIAEESTQKAVQITGVIGGVAMIVISIGMGLRGWSYPDWVAPYYLTWGGIVLLSIIIETVKRLRS